MSTNRYSCAKIYYFTGTGNAKRTAEWVRDECQQKGLDTELINISEMKERKASNIPAGALIGLISPTHGFHFPLIMRKFIRRFPKGTGQDVMVLNTRGGTRIGKFGINGLSGPLHLWAALVLKRKGYKIKGLFPVDLPSNWISIHPAFRKKGTDIIFKIVEPRVRKFTKQILAGKRNFKGVSFTNIVQDILISPISVLYNIVGKFLFAKSYIPSRDCNDCDLCEKTCPVSAIKTIRGRKYWTYKCESCMKCMNICPTRAIETAHGFLIAMWLTTSLVLAYFSGTILDTPPFSEWLWLKNGFVLFIIKSFMIFPFLFLGYRIMHFLMGFKPFERLFVLTSLTHLKIWGRYKK